MTSTDEVAVLVNTKRTTNQYAATTIYLQTIYSLMESILKRIEYGECLKPIESTNTILVVEVKKWETNLLSNQV